MQPLSTSRLSNQAILAALGGMLMGAGWMLLAVTFLAGSARALPGSSQIGIALCLGATLCFTSLHRRYSARESRPDQPHKPILDI